MSDPEEEPVAMETEFESFDIPRQPPGYSFFVSISLFFITAAALFMCFHRFHRFDNWFIDEIQSLGGLHYATCKQIPDFSSKNPFRFHLSVA